MLTPEYYKKAPQGLVDYFEDVEDLIIKDIARRMREAGELTETAEWQYQRLMRQGFGYGKIKAALRKESGTANKELTKILRKTTLKAYQNDMKYYRRGKKGLPEFQDNLNMVNYLKALEKATEGEFSNLTKTLGIPNKGTVPSLEEFYKKRMGQAMFEVQSGAFSIDDVLRRTINDVGEKGVRWIDYSSGRTMSLEPAIRRNILTTLGRITTEISLMNAESLGQDLMELTAHAGARPEHAEWQGKIVSLSGRKGYLSLDDIGYGEATGFRGVNCRHDWFPFFESSKRNYTDEQLKNIDPAPFDFMGKTYTYYEATQKQRQIENSIRKSKRKIVGFEEAGLEDDLLIEKIRLRRKQELYREFSMAGNMPRRMNRTYTLNKTYTFGYKNNTNQRGNFEKIYQKTLQHGKKTGNECLMWCDLDGNEILPIEFGNVDSVGITRDVFDFIYNQKDNSVISVHNHPASSSFSPNDINVACVFKSVKEMRVIGHDGTEYILEIGNGKRYSLQEIRIQYKDIKTNTRDKFVEIYINKLQDNKRIWKMQSNHILKKLAKQNGWRYERRLPKWKK